MSILELRKFKFYRFLESFLAIFSIGFLVLAIILAIFSPTIFSICLIVYSFLWLFKFCLNVFYTIFSFKQNRRWQTFDFEQFCSENNSKNYNQDYNSNNHLALKEVQKLEIDSSTNQNSPKTKSKNLNLDYTYSISILKNPKISSKFQVNNLETNFIRKNLETYKNSNFKVQNETEQNPNLDELSLDLQKIQKSKALENLEKFAQKFQNQIGWSQKIRQDIKVLKNNLKNPTTVKFWPSEVFHLPVFAVYNEPSSVLIRSLQKIAQNNYDLSKIIVIISQEARAGADWNLQIRDEITKESWLEASFVEKLKKITTQDSQNQKIENSYNLVEINPNQTKQDDLKITSLSDEKSKKIIDNLSKQISKNLTLQSENEQFTKENNEDKIQEKINLSKIFENQSKFKNQSKAKLQVFFCEHPDGMVGEIKGKASNEDWGARTGATILENLGIDKELVLVTSLDADSYLKQNFFWHLSYRFCASSNRHQAAFQPVHNYNHNFFEIGFWPRLVATQTTFYNLTNLALEDQLTTFAIYSMPLVVLEKVGFWVREVIAEDSLVFLKSLVYFKGQFQVIPHFGQMEADSVQHGDYLEEIISQYRQLQRWAWGGVEGFPYLFWQFFKTENGRLIELRIRLKWLYLLFSNHFFWATTPLIFGIGPFLPNFIHGNSFMMTSTSQNLSIFSQYFAWISYIFTFIFGYLTVVFIALKDRNSNLNNKKPQQNFLEESGFDNNFNVPSNWQTNLDNNFCLKNKTEFGTFQPFSPVFTNSLTKRYSNSQSFSSFQLDFSTNIQSNSQNFDSKPKSKNYLKVATEIGQANLKYPKIYPKLNPKSKDSKLNLQEIWAILVQIAISPFIYFLMAIPALDVQIRGFCGNYLGYWVTPKK